MTSWPSDWSLNNFIMVVYESSVRIFCPKAQLNKNAFIPTVHCSGRLEGGMSAQEGVCLWGLPSGVCLRGVYTSPLCEQNDRQV